MTGNSQGKNLNINEHQQQKAAVSKKKSQIRELYNIPHRYNCNREWSKKSRAQPKWVKEIMNDRVAYLIT